MSAGIVLPRNTAAGIRSRAAPAADVPALPPGRSVQLARRGTTFIRETSGPPGAPVVILLHGWGSTADLTWNRSYQALARQYRVIALDHRGHGRGIKTRQRFRLEDCADDVVALADSLGVDRFIPVGYSMGGPIASLVWQRHRDRVGGLVMCATSSRFNDTPSRRAAFAVLNGTSSLAALSAFRSLGHLSRVAWSRRLERRGDSAWAIEQVLQHDWPQVLAAGHEIGRFDSTGWIGSVDVPTAVVATLNDDVVATHGQLALADSVVQATLHKVLGGHAACNASTQFTTTLVDACDSVRQRMADGVTAA